jgi:hypothetical protein
MRVPAATFNQWYLNHVHLTEFGNKNLQAYIDASNPSSETEIERQSIMYGESEGIVMIPAERNTVEFIHSIRQFGGNLACPTKTVACLLGSSNTACPFSINEESLMAKNKICTPSAAQLLACDSVDALKDLGAPARLTRDNEGEHGFVCSSNAFMAPWQTKSILEANSKEPYQLIPALIQATKEFNSNNAEEVGFQSAVAHSGFLLRWLWATIQGLISKVNLFFGLDNSELREFSAQRHKECILPTITANGPVGQPAGGPETLNMLSSELSRLAETNARSNALRVMEIEKFNDFDNSKRNRVDKWIKHHAKLMLYSIPCLLMEKPLLRSQPMNLKKF